MSDRWHNAYNELTCFISRHPKINIGVSSVDIPKEIRPDFYRLFNKTREEFLSEKASTLLDEAKVLSRHYLQIEEELGSRFGAGGDYHYPLPLPPYARPSGQTGQRELYDPLFDLLRGKTNTQAFEEGSLKILNYLLRVLYHRGYEKWVILALTELLEPDEALRAIPDSIEWNIALKMSDNEAGYDVPHTSSVETAVVRS